MFFVIVIVVVFCFCWSQPHLVCFVLYHKHSCLSCTLLLTFLALIGDATYQQNLFWRSWFRAMNLTLQWFLRGIDCLHCLSKWIPIGMEFPLPCKNICNVIWDLWIGQRTDLSTTILVIKIMGVALSTSAAYAWVVRGITFFFSKEFTVG